MRTIVAATVLWSILWASTATTMPAHLVFTVPETGQHCYMTLSEEGDSVRVCECTGTEPISEVTRVYLWGARITGGGFQLVDSILYLPTDPVEGTEDSFPVPFAGNFYIETANPVGKSCSGSVVTVLPDVVTGVEPEPEPKTPFPPVQPTWYDVAGRRVQAPKGTGIFFQRVKPPRGATWARRVFVRASRPYSFGRWQAQ